MIEVGQLRCWLQRIPELPRESTPGTHLIMLETYEPSAGMPSGRRWLALHEGVTKWYYDREIEQFSEAMSDD